MANGHPRSEYSACRDFLTGELECGATVWRAQALFDSGEVQAETTYEAPADWPKEAVQAALFGCWRFARYGRDGSFLNPHMTVEPVTAEDGRTSK